MKRMLWLITAITLAFGGVRADDGEPGPDGLYRGTLQIPTGNLTLELTFKGEGGEKQTTFGVIEQGLKDFKVTSTKYQGDRIIIRVDQFGIRIMSRYDAEADQLRGMFMQGQANMSLVMDKVVETSTLRGTYSAKTTDPITNTVQLYIDEEANSYFIDWPAFNRYGVALKKAGEGETLDLQGDDGISVSVTRGAIPRATLTLGKTTVEALLTFAGQTSKPSPRPQTEIASNTLINHRTEAVVLDKEKGGRIEGMLTLPTGARQKPYPLAVLINGSGPQDFDSTIADHKPFLVLAARLADIGVASFRYNDRDLDNIDSWFDTGTSDDNAQDAAAALRQLKNRPDIDASRTLYIGHSEGGMIAPIAHTQYEKASLIILMAPTGVSLDRVIEAQADAIRKASGVDAATSSSQLSVTRTIHDAVKDETDPSRRLKIIVSKMEDAGFSDSLIKGQARFLASPWYAYAQTFDPTGPMRVLDAPTLALFGGSDLQVLASQNAEPVKKALEAAPVTDTTVITLKDHNHLFQNDLSGLPTGYGAIDETLSPAFLTALSDWIKARL